MTSGCVLPWDALQVVPLSASAGVIEMVSAVSLSDLLLNDDGAHARYRPSDLSHAECRREMDKVFAVVGRATQRASEEKLQRFREASCARLLLLLLLLILLLRLLQICRQFKPAMQYVFLESYPHPATWYVPLGRDLHFALSSLSRVAQVTHFYVRLIILSSSSVHSLHVVAECCALQCKRNGNMMRAPGSRDGWRTPAALLPPA